MDDEYKFPACGILQGSVLAPLLFTMYLKSFGKIIEQVGFSYHCYADDVPCYMSAGCSFDQFRSTLGNCLNKIAECKENNKLHLNHNKTQLMIFEICSPNTILFAMP